MRRLLNVFKNNPANVFLKIEDEDAKVEIHLLDKNGNRGARRSAIEYSCSSNWKIYLTYVTPNQGSLLGRTNLRSWSRNSTPTRI